MKGGSFGKPSASLDRREFLSYVGLGSTALSCAGPLAGSGVTAEQKGLVTHFPGARFLLGSWRLRLDRQNVGKKQGWYIHEPSDAVSGLFSVQVPSCWQEYVPDFCDGGVGWYFKDFELPADLRGKVLRLKFWAVDYFAEVWLNGEAVGSHEGGHTPFEVEITHQAKVGAGNRLVVRVVDPPRPLNQSLLGLPGWERTSDGVVDGFNFNEIPQGLQCWKEGFSFTRMAINPFALPFIDAADELGLLLQQDMSLSRMADSPQLLTRAQREVTELVKRDRNRPSIVIWCMVNEMEPVLKVVKQLAVAARDTDPTRLVTENTGGRTHYYLPYSKQGVSYLDEHYYPGGPVGEDVYQYCNERGIEGQLNFHTEFGIGGMNDIDSVLADYGDHPKVHMEDYRGYVRLKELREKWFNGSGLLKSLFGNLRNLTDACQTLQAEAVRRLTEVMRANPAVSGYDYCQVFDSNADEHDGLVDFRRNKRKKAFYAMKELNEPLVLVIGCRSWNSRGGEEVKLKITLVNEEQIEGQKRLTVCIQSPSGRQVMHKEVVVDAKPWVSVVFQGSVRVSGESGCYTVEATLRDGTMRLTHRKDHFTSFEPSELRWPSGAVAIFDVERQLEPFLEEHGMSYRRFEEEPRKPTVIVVSPFTALWRRPEEFRRLMRLFACIERGCTVIVLGLSEAGPGLTSVIADADAWFSPLAINSILPFSVTGGQDLPFPSGGGNRWLGRVGPHTWGMVYPVAGFPVPKHPIFEGVSNYGIMGGDFGNVAPIRWMAADVRAEEDLGPLVQIYGHGKGKVILSSMNLLPNLKGDALAEKLLRNLVNYADRGLPTELAPETPESAETWRFEEMGYQDCFTKFVEPKEKV